MPIGRVQSSYNRNFGPLSAGNPSYLFRHVLPRIPFQAAGVAMAAVKHRMSRSHGGARKKVHRAFSVRPKKSIFKGSKSAIKPVTQYQDSRISYVRKTASRRVKRRAIKFSRKVNRVVDNKWAVSKWRQSQAATVTTTAGQQSMVIFYLLSGADGSGLATQSTNQLAALNAFIVNQYASGLISATGTNVQGLYNESKFTLHGARLELQICSSTSNTLPAFVTLYHCYSRKKSSSTATGLINDSFLVKAVPSASNVAAGYASTTSINSLGLTLFDATEFCKNWIIKSVREHNIGVGQQIDLAWKDGRNYNFDIEDVVDQNLTAVSNYYISTPKYTECVVMLVQGAPGGGSTAGSVALSFNADAIINYSVVGATVPSISQI